MIQSLEIKNFQSHKHSKLNFCSGINIIQGQSDSGKSAIIRALKWVIYNRPLGDSFCSHWGGDTEVSLNLLPTLKVVRAKHKNQNIYKMEGNIYKAFGTEVPESIKLAINMNDINVQNQLDSPFLLSDSPGEVAAHFNHLADLSIIDRTFKNLNSKLKSEKNQLQFNMEALEEKKAELEAFPDLEKLKNKLEVLEVLQRHITETTLLKNSLSSLKDNLISVEEQIQKIEDIIEDEQMVNEILFSVESMKEKEQEYSNLRNIVYQLNGIDERIKELEYSMADLATIDNLLSKLEQYNSLVSLYNNIKGLILNIYSVEDSISTLNKEIKEMEKKYKETMGNTCPLCGQEVK